MIPLLYASISAGQHSVIDIHDVVVTIAESRQRKKWPRCQPALAQGSCL